MRKSGLPPVVDGNTEILIMGTLPGDKTLAAGQYYADPSNDFWKLVGPAFDKSIDGLSYEDKLELLKASRIGVWDAYHSCVRPGSMDGDISGEEFNDFAVLKELAPKLKRVCFNGVDAAAPEKSLVRLGYETRLLPSSSGANRRDQAGRLSRWKEAIQLGWLHSSKKGTIQMKTSDYFAELHVAGRLADEGWDIYFPHRDKGFDFVISKKVNGVLLLRPVQVKGKYPSKDKTDKAAYGYVGRLTEIHPEMVLAIPYFSASSPNTPVCIAFMPLVNVRQHSRGYRCQPATFRKGEPKPRREYQKFFDRQGILRLDSLNWKNEVTTC